MNCQPPEPIAVVGSGCHFAGNVNSPSELWKLLLEPRDVRRDIPDSRFNANGWYHPDALHSGRSNVKTSYLLDQDVTAFDAEFFGMAPVEAKATDVQQRLLMETVYEAVEAAGITIEGLKGSDTAVYVGAMWCDYEAMLFRDLQSIPTYTVTGNLRSSMSGRLSYIFDWHGPSMTVDTACSSSLVALHLAAQTLRAGDSRTAVACGTNVILGPENYISMAKLQLLSPDGISRMWDRDANGYARGDGVTALVLKTLSNALADGDHIECIIRATDVNNDGATPGFTMPSVAAQQALIRRTYKNAGFDSLASGDQPQYFEAHGTGTQAGDSVEAEAISRAFFGDGVNRDTRETPLYVGSIKTVLGHTEGSAGIAGVIKASLAVQNGCIPPNLSFHHLSHRVEPFYKGLQIAQTATTWPATIDSQPRRASVNSFGISGTNAHAIIESYDNPSNSVALPEMDQLFTPFVFSAASERSLRANIAAYAAFLAVNFEVNIHDLAWTLRQRRSAFDCRAFFVANSVGNLKSAIDDHLNGSSSPVVRARPAWETAPTKLLGIFTGQGAQYARMGADLIEKSSMARRIIEQLESYLAELPDKDRPTWSLKAELQADASKSRVQEAIMSQCLCAAVQILLVDLLRAANITFSAVIGHSSGEIVAAYAAGWVTARDAICVAFYRGLHVSTARSPHNDGMRGSMLAVGLSMAGATALCKSAAFSGRITVAASNSPSSVTISGDEDAVTEMKQLLKKQNIFTRRLFVDRAYHSGHMLACYEGYVSSLQRCRITAQKPKNDKCMWISSVYNRPVTSEVGLDGTYWAQNLTKPVLFSQALETVFSTNKFDLALEVGPHPALKQPVIQTIQATSKSRVEYAGTLFRGIDAVQAMSTSLGILWSYLGGTSVKLDNYERAMLGRDHRFRVIKGLPLYQWNHEAKYRHESRLSRNLRLRSQQSHPLLGELSPDSSPHQMTWKNVLRESEIDWLPDHQVQGQNVFPAAGYICTALEALVSLSSGKAICLIEMRDFCIHHAVPVDQDVEVLISMACITVLQSNHVSARFNYSAALGAEVNELTLAASADIDIFWGDPEPTLMPYRESTPSHMVEVDSAGFYQAMNEVGLGFGGRFAGLASISRKPARSSCLVKTKPNDNSSKPLVHPGELDSAIQSIFPAYAYPGTDRLSRLHLPQSCDLIRVSPSLCRSIGSANMLAPVDATITLENIEGDGFCGDINFFPETFSHAAIQLAQLKLRPVQPLSASDDRKVFFETHWIGSSLNGWSVARDNVVSQYERDILDILVRLSTFYLRQIDQRVPFDHPLRLESRFNSYLKYARRVTHMLENGEHKFAQKSWLSDTLEDIMEASNQFLRRPDVQLMHLVGQEYPRALNGECDMTDVLRASNLLDDYYESEFGLHQLSSWIARAVSDIADRHSHMNILEIGCGTGARTKNILQLVGHRFHSYTATDVSATLSGSINALGSEHQGRVAFKALDMREDPIQQGFAQGAYDSIIACSGLRATSNLEQTLKHTRKLLKPGGFLLIGEANESVQIGSLHGVILGTLPDWWVSQDDGRVLPPLTSPERWDKLLKSTGFSGIDTTAPDELQTIFGVSIFVSHAVDDTVHFLQAPLATPCQLSAIESLAILGGQSVRSSVLVKGLEALLQRIVTNIYIFETLEDISYEKIGPNPAVISLTELDKPVLKDITTAGFASLKKMFGAKKDLLWITSGRRWEEPFSNMTVGFGRTARNETPGLRLQFLDFEDIASIDVRKIAETFLRLRTRAEERDGILWTVEPEIVVDSEQKELIPRFRPVSDLNDRYNSVRRTITHEMDIKTSPIVLHSSQDGHGCFLKEMPLCAVGMKERVTELRTTHTIIPAIMTALGHKFLVLGEESSSGSRYLALVPSLASVLRVSSTCAIPCPTASSSLESLLAFTAAHLVAMALLDPLFADQTLVVHNPTDSVALAITDHARARNIRVLFTTDHAGPGLPGCWVKLSISSSRSALRCILPANTACFVGFWNQATPRSLIESILSSLPQYCRIETADTIFSLDGCDHASSDRILAQILERATAYCESITHQDIFMQTGMMRLEDLIGERLPSSSMTIVDWTSPTIYPVRVTSLESGILFHSNRTYWLAGLTGALGLSLCDWMISYGARSLVLTSRNPQVDPEWVSSHARNGVKITIISCDMTDEASLVSVKQTIDTTLSPVAGVMNGAAVFRDISIANMSLEQLNSVTGPKVCGSIYLDRLYRNHPLDFFILFSSISCVVGNPGQANYSAANAYMCSLAAQRRQRGLAATALNIGAIIGAGIIQRQENKAVELTVSKMALMRLSEEDFHQLIVGAIERGHPDSQHHSELSTGLLDVDAGSPEAPVWSSDPKFADFLVDQVDNNEQGKLCVTESLANLLKACKNRDDLEYVVKQAFAAQLRRVSLVTMPDEELMEKRSNDLGLDSLVSVGIREWFLKSFQVSIPVLKIIGNNTMASLAEEVAALGKQLSKFDLLSLEHTLATSGKCFTRYPHNPLGLAAVSKTGYG